MGRRQYGNQNWNKCSWLALFSENIKPSTLNKDQHVASVQPAWHADNTVIAFVFSTEVAVCLSAPNVIWDGYVI